MDISKSQSDITEVIDNYHLLKGKLENESNQIDAKSIEALDNLVTEEFDKILDLSPTNTAEAVKLVEFLLAALENLSIGSTLPDQINEKILQIVATDFNR